MEPIVRGAVVLLLVVGTASPLIGQTPQPFPGVRASQPEQPRADVAAAPRATLASQAAQPTTRPPAPADTNAPSAAVVGFPIFPNSQFLASYDAGKQQRYYVYGTTGSYAEVVKYYQSELKDRGAQVFAEPATHMFAQRFREETMAFPPGVTVKDWTSGGSQGYPNSKPGAQPARFPTVVVIVPPPPEPAAQSR
jgi:hypothetical protein